MAEPVPSGVPGKVPSPERRSRTIGLGLALAAASFLLDQASKTWLLQVFGLAERQPVHVAPGFDLILAWNPGISYSLLQAHSTAARGALIAATLLATGLLAVWLSKARTRLTAAALGLLIGGALGNALDRVVYGAVVDFVHLHAGGCSWYIFNVADCAIVLGVVALLLDWLVLRAPAAAKLP